MAMDTNHSVELRDVRLTLPGFSLALDMAVETGETLVLTGPSGSGKTTALNLIAGFIRQDAGRILIDGADAGALPPWKRDISIVFQDLALFPHLSVAGNVQYGLFVRGVKKPERRRAVAEALSAARLSGFEKRRIAGLSGGEKQRVAIARALASSPRLLLMDEPFSSLDAPLRRAVREEFLEIRRRSAAPCIFVTHDREEAALLGTRIALMKDGRIVESGTPRDLFQKPRTAFCAAFFGGGLYSQTPEIPPGGGVYNNANPPCRPPAYTQNNLPRNIFCQTLMVSGIFPGSPAFYTTQARLCWCRQLPAHKYRIRAASINI